MENVMLFRRILVTVVITFSALSFSGCIESTDEGLSAGDPETSVTASETTIEGDSLVTPAVAKCDCWVDFQRCGLIICEQNP